MKFLLIVLMSALTLTCFSTVHADDQISTSQTNPWSVEALGGWGFPNAYHGQLGMRAGYFFDNNIFTGIDYSHFFSGSSRTTAINLLSAEGGYRFMVSEFELIPYAGIGAAFLSRTTGDVDHLLVAPGLKINYPVGPVMVGLDNQYLIVPHHNAFAMAGTVGIRF